MPNVNFPAESAVTIRFAGTEPLTIEWDRLPAEVITRLAIHGLKQLVDDKMAGAEMTGGQLVKNDKPMKIGDAFMHDGKEVFEATFSRLAQGEWSDRKPGPGTKASRLPWPQRWLYGLCEEKAPAFILAGKHTTDGKVDRAPTKKNIAAMREALFTGEAFARWRDSMLAKCPPEPIQPTLSDEDLEALGLS